MLLALPLVIAVISLAVLPVSAISQGLLLAALVLVPLRGWVSPLLVWL